MVHTFENVTDNFLMLFPIAAIERAVVPTMKECFSALQLVLIATCRVSVLLLLTIDMSSDDEKEDDDGAGVLFDLGC
jgi:hypothetical protein